MAVDWAVIREESLTSMTLAALPTTIALPALPHAVARFIERSRDDAVHLKELADIVQTDTGLTLELLKHVNSSFIGLRQKAKSVQQALSLLGLRQSKLFLIAAGTQAAVRSRKSKLINQSVFWNASFQKALFAREVARLLRADDEIAFAGALLQDYLLPVLTNELCDAYASFIDHRETQPECLAEFETGNFGWDHARAGASLAHRWKLPDELVCCILFHHHGLSLLSDSRLGRTSAAAVAISAMLPDHFRQHYTGLDQLLILEERWSAFHLAEIVQRVDDEQSQTGMGTGHDFTLMQRCRKVLGADFGKSPSLALA